MASFLDYLGGGLTPVGRGEVANLGFGDAIGQNRNALIGLGLGLMQPGGNPWGTAMAGFQTGARTDEQTQYRNAMLAQHAADKRQAQANADRAYGLQLQQFNKPTILHVPTEDDEGNKGTDFYLQSPNGSIRKITPDMGAKLSQQLPIFNTGADTRTYAQGGPAPIEGASGGTGRGPEEDTSIPPAAQYAQQGAPPAYTPKLRPKEANQAYSKEVGKATGENAQRSEAGGRVISMIDSLMEKTKNPIFNEAAGPYNAEISNSPMWDPRRLAWEYGPGSPSTKAKGFLREIESQTQAINSELQRAYLSGQGSVTENERAQISRILGQIPAARNVEEAQALLRNAKEIIGTAFQRGYVVPNAAAPPQPNPLSPDDAAAELRRRGVIR